MSVPPAFQSDVQPLDGRRMFTLHGHSAGLDGVEHGALDYDRAVASAVINICVILETALLVEGKGIVIVAHGREFDAVATFRLGVVDQDLHHLAPESAMMKFIEHSDSQ